MAAIVGGLPRLPGERDPEACLAAGERVLRHDADHAVVDAAEAHVAAENGGVLGEHFFPEAVAEDDELVLIEDGVVFGEEAAHKGGGAEDVKVGRSDEIGLEADGGAFGSGIETGIHIESDGFEDVGQPAAVVVIGDAVLDAFGDAGAGIDVAHGDQAVRFGEGQRCEDDACIQHRKDRSVGADAEGQREQGSDGEGLLFPEKFKAEAKVLEHAQYSPHRLIRWGTGIVLSFRVGSFSA